MRVKCANAISLVLLHTFAFAFTTTTAPYRPTVTSLSNLTNMKIKVEHYEARLKYQSWSLIGWALAGARWLTSATDDDDDDDNDDASWVAAAWWLSISCRHSTSPFIAQIHNITHTRLCHFNFPPLSFIYILRAAKMVALMVYGIVCRTYDREVERSTSGRVAIKWSVHCLRISKPSWNITNNLYPSTVSFNWN